MRIQKRNQKPTNRNWGKPMPISQMQDNCAFDKVVGKLGLTPEQYETSETLKYWVKRHHKNRYIPEEVLLLFGMRVEVED